MITAKIILAFLQVAKILMDMAMQERWIKAGEDKAIAKMAESIHRKTEAGKQIWEKVDAMSDAQVDDALRDLEPK